jgi:hypothetical protein
MWTVALWLSVTPSLLLAQTIDHHGAPSVACANDGSFVIVWQSRGQDGDDYGIIGQRFDSSGGRRGTEFLVNSYTTDVQRAAAVCSDDQSRFVVVWQSYGQDDDGYGIFARRFDSAGEDLGVEFQVANTNLYSQQEPDVACSAAGDFVVVWSSGNSGDYEYGIVARHFTSTGSSSAGEFNVNTYTSTSQVAPSVTVDGTGGFVIAWTSYENQDGDGYGVFARRFGSDGTALGDEILVNTYTASNQLAPEVAADADGAFVVAWSSSQDAEPSYDVFGQRFGSAGATVGSEFQINTYTTGDQGVSFNHGRVDIANSGGDSFIVVWESDTLTPPTQDGDGIGVFGQRFSGAPPAPAGTEFRVNSATAGDQAYPAVCATASGGFVVAWDSRGAGVDAIVAQRYDSGGSPLGPEIHVNSDTVRPLGPCPGDCDGSMLVSIDELVRGVNIALARRPVADCTAFDGNASDTVTVDELVTAVRAAVEGCPAHGTPTPVPTSTPPGDSRPRGKPPTTRPATFAK